MEDEIEVIVTPEDFIYGYFPWSFPTRPLFRRYAMHSIHPLFGVNYGRIYYHLPVIAEQDELEPEHSSERIQIEELPNDISDKDDDDNGIAKYGQQQSYIVEEPPEESVEKITHEGKLPPESYNEDE